VINKKSGVQFSTHFWMATWKSLAVTRDIEDMDDGIVAASGEQD